MAGKIDARLEALGITIPTQAQAAGNYVGFVVVHDLVFLAGQVPIENGVRKFIGKVGREVTVEQAQQAARLAATNVLAHLKAACGGDLDRVLRCVRLTGYVNGVEDFLEHPKVINGASDLMVAVFGEAGKHARSAVGAGSLPSGVAVEVEAIFQLRQT
jgi:enamine deaminase RidA (YjgF/YER057c/UK114 family)